jgi:phosphoadenosine phosphosulfate reductase
MNASHTDEEVPQGNLLFPIFLKLEQLNVLIVGGGKVGLEKLTAILKNSPSTQITLVATVLSPEVRALVTEYPNVEVRERPYQSEDLNGHDLVIAATNDRLVSEQIKREAKEKKILANVADTPDLCDFYLGSIVKKGDLKIAISTNGKSPTLAKRMREFFEGSLPDDTQALLDNLRGIRSRIQGDFNEKLTMLNELTSSFIAEQEETTKTQARQVINFHPDRIAELNRKYEPLTPAERILELYKDFPADKVLFTSSFAANSIYLLHLFATLTESRQPVHFIDTTYHFKETLAYKRRLTQLYNLKVVDVKPDLWKNKFTREYELWRRDADLCCKVNKTEPMDAVSQEYEVWVSGLMRSQNDHRKALKVFEEKNGMIRFYPILDVTDEQRDNYIEQNHLPLHPLLYDGYGSIGCTHCTVRGQGREGRWAGLDKTECGLHI